MPVEPIEWVDAAGDYLCIHASGNTHILRATMREMENLLDPRLFQRVHRSTIVNLTRVKSLRAHMNGEYFLRLEGGQELKLSRTYRDKVEYLPEAPARALTRAQWFWKKSSAASRQRAVAGRAWQTPPGGRARRAAHYAHRAVVTQPPWPWASPIRGVHLGAGGGLRASRLSTLRIAYRY